MKLIDLFVSDPQSAHGAAPEPTVSRAGEGGVSQAANTLFDWIGRGADVYREFKGASSVVAPNTPSQTTPGTAPAAATSGKSWLPWVLGGGVVLVVLYFVMRRA